MSLFDPIYMEDGNLGSIQLLDVMPHPDTGVSCDMAVVNAARVSYNRDSKGEEADKKLIDYLMRNKHTSPFEHVEFKFRIKMPIFVARQWMRHRTWSYNEISRRYTSENVTFYLPSVWREQADDNKQASVTPTDSRARELEAKWGDEFAKHTASAYNLYSLMLQDGVAREQARMILPVNMHTELVAKVDAHNLMHFLSLRMHPHAQQEIRVYADTIFAKHFKVLMPWTAEAFVKHKLLTN